MLTISNVDHFHKVMQQLEENNIDYSSLEDNLSYLNQYGSSNESSHFKVDIGYDFAKYSFGVVFFYKKRNESEWRYYMNGCLFYHEPTNSWSVNT